MGCLRNEARLAGPEINAWGEARQGLRSARLWGEGSGGSSRQNGLCFLPDRARPPGEGSTEGVKPDPSWAGQSSAEL